MIYTNCTLLASHIEEGIREKMAVHYRGFIYDEKLGLPHDGISPGTKWAEIPDDWMCPDCGVGKEDFEMSEI